MIAVGIAGLALALRPGVPVAATVAAWTIAGLGMGLSYAPISVTVLGTAEPGQEGRASASLQLTDVLGVALGTGLGGVFVALGDGRGWATVVVADDRLRHDAGGRRRRRGRRRPPAPPPAGRRGRA